MSDDAPEDDGELGEALDPRGPTLVGARRGGGDLDHSTVRVAYAATSTDEEIPKEAIEAARAARARAKSQPPEPLAPGTPVGEYEIDQKIGEGSMSEVYRAIHTTIGRRVAIKVISPHLFDDPDAEGRFLREARTVAAVHHQSIVDVFGFGMLDDGRVYLVMEWLDGRSLATRMLAGPLTLELAGDLLLQITSALRAAHEKGIVHRDLKPENVFLVEHEDEKPIVKLLDFGLAKRAGDDHPSHTPTGQVLGTPRYMSPEQARGMDVDHRSDIYSLGCIAYQMYTGLPPFEGDAIDDLMAAHLGTEPPAPRSRVPDLPEVLDVLLLDMLAKDPLKRPTIARVRRAIQSALGHASGPMRAVSEPSPEPSPEPPKPAASRVSLVLLVLAVVIAAAALAVSLGKLG